MKPVGVGQVARRVGRSAEQPGQHAEVVVHGAREAHRAGYLRPVTRERLELRVQGCTARHVTQPGCDLSEEAPAQHRVHVRRDGGEVVGGQRGECRLRLHAGAALEREQREQAARAGRSVLGGEPAEDLLHLRQVTARVAVRQCAQSVVDDLRVRFPGA